MDLQRLLNSHCRRYLEQINYCKMYKLILPILFFVLISARESTAQEYTYPFNNPDLTIEERVNDLVDRLTLEEKVSQMMYESPAIPRLGIPKYNWWNESLHGVGRAGVATVFPQAIALGATFDEDLIYRVATAISTEARAKYNAAVKMGYRQQYAGLTFWSPNVNIFRDPRWGRGQETYGESPWLTSQLGVAYIDGLQGYHPKYLKAAAGAKHFAVHSGPEKLRHEFDAQASIKDMHEFYFPAFKAAVGANVETVMCAYNRVNGEVSCGSSFLLEETLRENWGFDGHVVSDCWAIQDFYSGHNVVDSAYQAAAMAVKNGVNLNCGSNFDPQLLEAEERGLIAEDEIDQALADLLRTRFRLGLFDPAEMNPYNKITPEVINSPQHRHLSREAAQKSMVLLKNNGVLPLKNDLSSYFVTGPNATSIEAILGNYHGVNPDLETILEGIAGAVEPASQVKYRYGTLLDRQNVNPIDWTTGAAKASDVTFAVLGINTLLEGEEGASIASPHYGDRLDYNLPENQLDFLRTLREDNEKPIISIITGGSPMNLTEVQELSDAVLLVWYPGQEGGTAVADIIFGEVSPSARLPLTFPKSLDQLPPYEDYSIEGRTYMYMEKEPLYPFGYGLSYADFAYSDIELSTASISNNESTEIEVSATVRNEGESESDEIVQLYITPLDPAVRAPRYMLRGVERVHLTSSESKKVSFSLTSDDFRLVNTDGEHQLYKGKYTIYVGGSLPDKRSMDLGMPQPAEIVLTVK